MSCPYQSLCTHATCRSHGCALLTHLPIFDLSPSDRRSRSEFRKSALLSLGRRTCYYCGLVLTSASLTRDHKVPVSKGGTGRSGNILDCCRKCNEAKADMDYYEFLRKATSLGIVLRADRVLERDKHSYRKSPFL